MKKYPNELARKWEKYREKCSAASDPDEQERLSRNFKTDMRKIAGKAEDAYNKYMRRAIQPQK